MIRIVLLLTVIFLLPACTEMELASHVAKQAPIPSNQQSTGNFKVGNSYNVKGTQYTPRETYSFTQTGIASWYGPNFHGKKTANGETFDKYELTAAHKTLQMPSIIRVTNLENGRSIIARVNDRGPFSKSRILDLSERAADLLDFKNKGTAKVKIQVLEKESMDVANIARNGGDTRGYELALNQKGYRPAPVAPSPRPVQLASNAPTPLVKPTINPSIQPMAKPETIFVQAGSFSNVVKARALADKIQTYGPARIASATINGNKFYRVQVGPMQTETQAEQVAIEIASANIGEPILIRE